MKNRIYLWLAACLVLLLGISLSVPAKSAEASRAGFTEADKAYYLPEALIALLRPGIDFTLVDVALPDDRQLEVTFTLTDPDGDPLDLFGNPAYGTIDLRFMLTYIPLGEKNKVKLTEGSRDAGGEYTEMGDGMYLYKFGTVLPEDYEVDATYTLASVATQDFRQTDFAEYGLSRYFDNDVYNFVPSGASDPMPRDIVVTETCNNCHNPLGLHGGRYMEVQVCTQCHNPDYLGAETAGELSYEFSALVHRVHSSQEEEVGEIHYPVHPIGELEALKDCQVCHTGGTPTADRPLVAKAAPACDGTGLTTAQLAWGDEGPVEIRLDAADGKLYGKSSGAGSSTTGKWVKDGMDFVLVDAADGATLQKTNVDLTVFGCAGNAPYSYGNPEGTVGAMHSNWMTNPGREACGGCHTYIDWETGEGHPAGKQEDDQFCSFCHQADSGKEFDASVKGAHTLPLKSSVMAGVLFTVKEVTNTGPGQSPTVVFSLSDKNGRLDPAALQTFTMTLTGPNDDFEVNIRENALGKVTAVGSDWKYTFSGKIPPGAEGSYSVGYEGRITRSVNGSDERDSAENALFAVAVTDSEPMERRKVVDDAKCEACHSNLSLHGDNRKNATEYCQTCHMPSATDEEVRLEGEAQGIHFKYMIHKIHRGARLENQPYIVYGYRSSVHDYSEVVYPGDLRDCDACHVDTDPRATVYRSSSWLPLPEGALPTHSPAAQIPDMGPATATCLSCHDGDAAASHALANSSGLGESCDTCHGEGKTYSVQRVHAR